MSFLAQAVRILLRSEAKYAPITPIKRTCIIGIEATKNKDRISMSSFLEFFFSNLDLNLSGNLVFNSRGSQNSPGVIEIVQAILQWERKTETSSHSNVWFIICNHRLEFVIQVMHFLSKIKQQENDKREENKGKTSKRNLSTRIS